MASASYRGRMIVNDTDYTGSFVDPNPNGTATDMLTKLGIDGTVYEIQGGGGSNFIVDAQTYSLEERQVGVWTNGKPIYQKTIQISSLPSTATYSTYPHGISNIETIVDTEGYVIWADGAIAPINSTQLNGSSVNSSASFDYYVDLTNVGIGVGMDRSAMSANVTIKYTKTTDEEGSGGYQAYGMSPVIYSEKEREIGVWINNKPLYQKTLVFENYTNGTYQDISSLNIEEIVNNFGEHRISDYSYGLSFPYYENNNWYSLMTFDKNNGRYYIYCSSSMASTYKRLFITIQYTKTTDVAGSGEYNTLGVPNVHYSENEQVIGAWTDGKPLYQKTLKSNSGIAQNSWVIIINDSNIRIKNYYGYIYYSANLEDGTKYPLDWTRVANSAYSCTECNGGDLEVLQNVGTSYGYDITIQYTKTSD